MAKYLENGPCILKSELQHIEKGVSEPNRAYLLKYEDFLSLNGRKDRTRYKRLFELRTVCGLGVCKDFKALTKEDVEEIVRRVNRLKAMTAEGKSLDRDLNSYSKARIKLTFKQFVRWLLDSKADALVGWVKLDMNATNAKLPTEMLDETDIERLLTACRNVRDRALICLLWDTGARIGEVLNLRMKDLTLSSKGPSRIILTGKTGTRITPLSVSVPALTRYVNEWRRGAASEAPLFVTIRHNEPTQQAMDYPNVKTLLVDLKRRSGLEKRLHAHVLRYSRCTYLISHGMSTSAMVKFFGWKNEKMVGHYGKLSTAQVEEDFFRAMGMKQNGEPEKPKLTAKLCYKCHAANEPTAHFCINCASSLDKTPYEQLDDYESLRSELHDMKAAFNLLLERLDAKTKENVMKVLEK